MKSLFISAAVSSKKIYVRGTEFYRLKKANLGSLIKARSIPERFKKFSMKNSTVTKKI
jgi:hypothetical protein